MTQALFGKLFGDKGYISQPLFELLFGRGVQLITKLKKNMKNKLLPLMDKLLTRKLVPIGRSTINLRISLRSSIPAIAVWPISWLT